MALLYCIDCGGQVSDQATNCPHCGRPIYRDEQVQKMVAPPVIQSQFQQNSGYQTMPTQKRPSENPLIWIGALIFFVGFVALLLSKEYFASVLFLLLLIVCIACLLHDPSKRKPIQAQAQPKPQKAVKQLCCRRCGSNNIQITVQNVEHIVGTSSEVRKKSALTRAGNSIGRAGMIALTGGLWALTPKKSKYRERNRVNSYTMKYKTAVCQNCGYSWDM